MVKGSESSLPCMLHLLLSGRARPQIQLRAKPPTEGTGKVHHGVPAALCTSPTRLLQHFGLRELAHEVTEQNRDLYSEGGKRDFSIAILCHQHKKIKTELWKRGKKTFVFVFWSLRSEQVEKARQRWRRLQEAGACVKHRSGRQLYREKYQV